MTELGKILKRLRIDFNEQQQDMAKKLGISTPLLSSIENGWKSMPNRLVTEIIYKYHFDLTQIDEFERVVFFNNNMNKKLLEGLDEYSKEYVLNYIWDKKRKVQNAR